jgi:hypothetical protein
MTNLKYQNYLHYKLPITINLSEYGKLVEQIGNKYIIQLKTNILIINQKDDKNFIKLYRNGELMFEFKDSKISDELFTRTIQDQRYTFKNGKLILTEILTVNGYLTIYEDSMKLNFNPLFILLIIIMLISSDNYESLYQLSAIIPFKNIIKLRKVKSKHK